MWTHSSFVSPAVTYTARRKKPTLQLHSAGTVTCNQAQWLHVEWTEHELRMKGWLLSYSPAFSYVTPDLEEVKVPAETEQEEHYTLVPVSSVSHGTSFEHF